MKNLFLFFPQWQGSGKTDELYRSAKLIQKGIRPYFNFLDVPVTTTKNLEIKNGILSFDQVFSQFKVAKKTIEDNNPEKIFIIGGDCSVEIAPVSYLNKVYDSQIAILWFDAHGDLNTPESSPSQTFHGMPLRLLLGEGEKSFVDLLLKPVNRGQVVLAGTRNLDKPESEYIESYEIKQISSNDLEENTDTLLNMVKEMGVNNVYIHLDLDVLDPKEFSDVKCPTSFGLSIKTLLSQINKLKSNFRIVGASIVEYSTDKDECDSRLVELAKLLFA